MQGTKFHGITITSGVSELSLRKLPVELEDLEQLKASLPQLKVLHLSEAQKLPPDTVSMLLAPHTRGGMLHSVALRCSTSPDCNHLGFLWGWLCYCWRGAMWILYHPSNGKLWSALLGSLHVPTMLHCHPGDKSMGLRAVSFVRCFQMTHEGLDTALTAAAAEGSGLRMVAFSHLDLSEWPEGHNHTLPQDRPAPNSYDFALRATPQPVVQPPAAGSLQVASASCPLSGSVQCLDGL